MPRSIDLNCDMGEGVGADRAIMPLISSANIACGAHAGDEATMRATVELAIQFSVAVGAHPGFADRTAFGRGEVEMPPLQITELVAAQIDLMLQVCRNAGARMNHVKPHGALYNRACRDPAVAAAIVAAVRRSDPGALLFAPSSSTLAEIALGEGVTVVAEIFADRTYRADGSLTPRTEPAATITDPAAGARQVLHAVRTGRIPTTARSEVAMEAATVCIHGDSPRAVSIATAVRAALDREGIIIEAPLRLG